MATHKFSCSHCGKAIERKYRDVRTFRACSRECHAAIFKATHTKPLESRFWSKVQKTDGCWLWVGAKHGRYGHGKMLKRMGEPLREAHRVSWELHYGPIPDGMCVLHRCDNPPCVRPEHLFIGSRQDNSTDMVEKRRNQRGNQKPNAKLTEADVISLRASTESLAVLAHKYRVSKTVIRLARIGRTWKHVLSDGIKSL